MRALPIILALMTSCGTPPRKEAIPYRFRQSMIEGASFTGHASRPPERTGRVRRAAPPPRASAAWRRGAAGRCSALAGRTFAGDHRRAVVKMIRACLRRVTAATLRGRDVEPRPGHPRLADLVLFHNTLDRNRNGKLDDTFTDAGVVVSRRGGRIRFIFLRRSRVRLGVLNLGRPDRRRVGVQIQNTFLRIKQRSDPPHTPYLAGQLLAGFVKPPAAR